LVEQNARHALALADHVLVLVGGQIVHSGPTSEITAEDVAGLYFQTASEDSPS
jgi:ABC-type branched-subunit amino acid transport system ATPase component